MASLVVAAGKALGVAILQNVVVANIIGALLYIGVSKLLAPKVPKGRLSGHQVMAYGGLEYRKHLYGQSVVSGTVVYKNVSGDGREYLWFVVAMLDHEVEDLVGVWFDGDFIPKADIDWTPGTGGADGSGTGEVSTSKWIGDNSTKAVRIWWYPGHPDQVASGILVSTFTEWTTNHRGRGVAYVVVSLRLNKDTEDIWRSGEPRDIKAEWKGRRVFDPRKYALNDDPDFETTGKTVGGGLRWFNSHTRTTKFGNNVASWSVTGGVLTATDNDASYETLISETFDLDTSKRYVVRVDARLTAGDRASRLFVDFYDANGNHIEASGDSATGWASKGTYFYAQTDTVYPGSFTEYTLDFGAGGTAEFPQDTVAIQMAVGMILMGPGSANTTVEVMDLAIHEHTTTRHDFSDDSTWEYSSLPPLCGADYLTQIKGVNYARIGWQSCIDAANDCAPDVDIPGPSTEPRFLCNGVVSEGDEHRENIDAIAASMAGKITPTARKWQFRASVWREPELTIDEFDFAGDLSVRGASPARERYNTVRGFFIDAGRDYQAVEFPHVDDSTYIARDNGKVKYLDIELSMVTSETQAQRIAYRRLHEGNRQKVIDMPLNPVGAKVAVGDTAYIQNEQLGWSDGGNLLPDSNDLSQWNNGQSTDVQDVGSGPFGTADANSINEDGTAANTHYVNVPVADWTGDDDTVYTYPVWLKASNRTWAAVHMNRKDSINARAYFDLANGRIGTINAQCIAAYMHNYGDGWYRCVIVVDVGSGGGNTAPVVYVAEADNDINFDGLSQESLLFYGAQVVEGHHEDPFYVETIGAAATTAPITARCFEWVRREDMSFRALFSEDDASAYDDPEIADYGTVSAGGLTVPSDVVPPPSNLAATAVDGGVQLTWTLPPNIAYDFIDVYEDTDSSWSGATKIASVRADTLFFPHEDGGTYYYWVRARRGPTLESIRDPDSDTSTISATVGTAPAADPVTAIGRFVLDASFDPDTAEASYRSDSDGDAYEYEKNGAGSFVSIGTWLQSGAATDYDVGLFDDGTGSGDTPTGSAIDTWLDAGSDRTWTLTDTTTSGSPKIFEGTLKYRDATTLAIISQASVKIQCNMNA